MTTLVNIIYCVELTFVKGRHTHGTLTKTLSWSFLLLLVLMLFMSHMVVRLLYQLESDCWLQMNKKCCFSSNDTFQYFVAHEFNKFSLHFDIYGDTVSESCFIWDPTKIICVYLIIDFWYILVFNRLCFCECWNWSKLFLVN